MSGNPCDIGVIIVGVKYGCLVGWLIIIGLMIIVLIPLSDTRIGKKIRRFIKEKTNINLLKEKI